MCSATIRFTGSNIDQNTWESDGTYSFGYKSADSERHEVADANGVVTGSYVTLDASGKPMTVRYTTNKHIIIFQTNNYKLKNRQTLF